jgi:hypothetical protein
MNAVTRWLLFAILLSGAAAQAQTINAASCSQSDIQNALSSASAGTVINLPAGSCSWSGLTIAKGVTLSGAGTGKTNITISGTNTVTKQSAVLRITGISFSISGGGNANKGFIVNGSWKSAQPIVFANDAFTVNGSGLFDIQVAGGVIFSHNTFNGGWDDSFMQIKDAQDTQGSWKAADTMGTKDTNGTLNLYIEDNTFTGGTNQGIDCDDACRVVYRHNTLINSSFNSHGSDTSAWGLRHFEIYNNAFKNTGAESGDSSQLANENQAIWIRGATGVIYNNTFENLAGSFWGNKPEIRLNNRGAEDAGRDASGNTISCSSVKYPAFRQLGQNFNGSSYFTDPIYFWGNTGASNELDGWNWGNPCGYTWSTYFQWGRDAVNQAITGGTAKPGYTAYQYPHPLAQAGASTGPNSPSGLQAIVN